MTNNQLLATKREQLITNGFKVLGTWFDKELRQDKETWYKGNHQIRIIQTLNPNNTIKTLDIIDLP